MISQESFQRRKAIFAVVYNSPLSGLKISKNYPFVRIKDEYQSEAYKWCQENYGENWIWSSHIQTNYTDIYFLDQADALFFKLKFNTLITT